MRIVLGQGQQPISIDSRWWRGDRDELHIDLEPGESAMIDVPNLAQPGSDSLELVTIGMSKEDPGDKVEFYIDVSSDATESTERVWSRIINTNPEV